MGKRKLDSGKSQPKISNLFSKAEASGSKSSKSSNDTVSQYCLSLNNETLEKPEETQKETENSASEATTAATSATETAISSG